MEELQSRPRFHALIWGQMLGIFIIIAGMGCYWSKVDSAQVPLTVTLRVLAIVGVIFFSFLIPQFLNGNILRNLARNQANNPEGLANNPAIVRRLLWGYSYGNLALITYLVHITGGITGSMFTPLFLMLPSVPLLLRGVHLIFTKWAGIYSGAA